MVVIVVFIVITVIVFKFRNAVALFVEDLLKMSKTLQFSVVLLIFEPVDQPGSMLDECFHGRVDLTWLRFIG